MMGEATGVEALRAEIEALRRELDASQQRISRLEAAPPPAPGSMGPVAEASPDRRGFFKLAAGAAAGAVAATVATASPAAAETGASMLIGDTNLPDLVTDVTRLESPSFADLAPTLFASMNFTGDESAPDAGHRVAVYGMSVGPDAASGMPLGVMGDAAPGTGVEDLSCVGVYGRAAGPAAVTPDGPVGVFGHAGADGTGVLAQSEGLSLDVGAAGRMRQSLRGTGGAPTGFSAFAGEQARDLNGDLYLCVASGDPGVWRKVVAQHPAFEDRGGSINLLTAPIRLVDTRGGAPLTNGGAKLPANTPVQLQITGTSVGNVSVPGGAVGVFGNIAAVLPDGTGFLTVYPADAPLPNAANLNYSAALPAINNSFMCRLSGTGAIRVRAGQKACHLVLDVTGFLF